MPAPRPKTSTKTTAKPVKSSTRSSAPKSAPMVPNRRVKRTTYTKMGSALNNMGSKR